MSNRTTVSVSPETASALHELKDRGDTYEDVIRSLLDRTASDAPEATAQ